MNPKAFEHRCSELSGRDVGISARYHWSVARQLTSFPLRHWNLKNPTLQQECYLTNTRANVLNGNNCIKLLLSLNGTAGQLGNREESIDMLLIPVTTRDQTVSLSRVLTKIRSCKRDLILSKPLLLHLRR